KKWHVDAREYGRYIEHAFDLGYDLRNDGTLYPPTRGGRKAFMARLEEMERECARIEAERERIEAAKLKAEERAEREWIAKTMKVRFEEIEAFQKSLRRTATLRGCGYTLVLAKTQKELRAEGRRMGNCVGNGTYGRGIVEGDRLIVMLGLGGKSYCDIEIDRRTWGVRQCYLKGNQTPPEEVRKLANLIAKQLKDEHRRHRKAGLFNVPRRKAA
ncbi:MAG: PcfJ domain-containing protein, partial [Kiritimatiellae bacterium]|nr:PcfJ domain-containing protein [Kiritimatiellia bacterium]